MTDPRDVFATSLDLSAARLVDFPGFIFLCGGRLTDPPSPPQSVREVVRRLIAASHPDLATRLVKAEDINNWMLDGVYKDLFTLEQDLAALASTIVIILESPGSIAEFGAFSALDGVKEKLLVFIQSARNSASSFISLGPARHLQGLNSESVCAYPWLTIPRPGGEDVDIASADRCAPGIVEDIANAAKPRRGGFEPTQARDQMLLVCDLVDHLLALKLREIRDLLIRMGVVIAEDRLKSYLFVLEKLGLLQAVDWGVRHRFYLRTDSRRFFRLSYGPGLPAYDRSRVQADAAEYYKKQDGNRHNVITQVLATAVGAGV